MATKRDWLQIVLNVVIAFGWIFLAYSGLKYPNTALKIVLSLAAAMALVALICIGWELTGRIIARVSLEICKMDDERQGGPSGFSLADRLRLRLLRQPLLAKWCPQLWDHLREGLRRSRCCEISGCWNDPTYKMEGHRICFEHYTEMTEIASAKASRMKVSPNPTA